MGGRSLTDPQWQNTRGSASRPPGQGTPCRVPSSPRSATLLHVSPSLEGQTTFKSDETRTIATVSKRASQQRKNRIDRKRVVQEKPEKPRETGRNEEMTKHEDPPGALHLGARPWEAVH